LEWHDQSAQPAPLTPPTAPLAPTAPVEATAPVKAAAPTSGGPGLRRTVLTGALAGLLLVGGLVAVVSAASPDPGASTAPSTTADPNDDTTTDPNGGTTAHSTRPGHAGGNAADCPDKGTGGSSGSDDSGTSGGSDSSGSSAPAETPAT
jgi:hypothetical protein